MSFHSPMTMESIPLFNRRTNEEIASCSTYMHLRFIGPPRENIAYMKLSSTSIVFLFLAASFLLAIGRIPFDVWVDLGLGHAMYA